MADLKTLLRDLQSKGGWYGLEGGASRDPLPSTTGGLSGLGAFGALSFDSIGRSSDSPRVEGTGNAKDPSGVHTMFADPVWSELTKITRRDMPDWEDNIVYAQAFRDAFKVALSLKQKGYNNAMQAREITSELMNLMPPSMRNDAPFGPGGRKEEATRLFHPFPEEVRSRFPSFEIRDGDLPKIGEAFAVLDRPKTELSAGIFRDGQGGMFFTPDNRLARIERIEEIGGEKIAVCSIEAIHRWTMEWDGFSRRDELVQPGEHQVRIPVKDLEARVFGTSSDNGYSLDKSSAEDRAIALAYGYELKQASLHLRGETRTVFDWIERADRSFSRDELLQIQRGAQEAATRAIGKYTAHPRRIHFKLDTSQPWGKECAQILDGVTSSTGSHYTQQQLGGDQSRIDERNWTSRFLGHSDSFITGNANCYGSGEMRAKLLGSMLRPLGIWPDGTGVSHDTHGAFFERFATPDPATGTIQLSEPMQTKMNERIFANEAHIGMGRGREHGGRFNLHGPRGSSDQGGGERSDFYGFGRSSGSWEPTSAKRDYQKWLS
jgi:hypothetical protein